MLAVKYPWHMDVLPLKTVTNKDHDQALEHDIDHDVEIVFETTDESLMLAYAKHGDHAAFTTLYTKHKNSLYRYCVRMVGNEALGAELFQDAWSKVIKAREHYKVKAKFKTYLFHVARNLIIDHWRKKQPDMVSFHEYDDSGFELDSEIDLVAEIERSEQIQEFKTAVLQLPPIQRDVVLLHYDHGLSLEQIATLDGIGRETVKSRLRYAMKKLKQTLNQEKQEPNEGGV